MKYLLFLILMTAVLAASANADRIDKMIDGAMKALQIPGVAVAALKDGKPVKMKAYGLANIDYNVKMRTDTPFLLASMTKSFTAASIMMLVEEGKVRLDDPISTYLADTPESWNGITVRHLLTHTAGLKDRFEEKTISALTWKLTYTMDEMYKAARETPVDFKPGEMWQYSDQGFFLLGMIIEKASGMTYPDFLKKRIFEPRGMKSSSTVNLSKIVKGMAAGYTQVGGVLYHNNRRTDYGMVSHFGIISTVEDLAKWDAGLNSDKLLKHSTLEQMWIPAKLNNGELSYSHYGAYGMGWFVNEFNGHRSVGHGGSTGTAFLKFPEDKLTIIVLTNLEQIAGGDATGIADSIARTYIPDLAWGSLKPKPDDFPKNTATFRKAIEDLAQGKADEAIYVPPYYTLIKSALPQQKAGLSPLGSIQKIEYLGSKPWGAGRVAYYRVQYKEVTLYAPVGFDSLGRIQSMELQPEKSYED